VSGPTGPLGHFTETSFTLIIFCMKFVIVCILGAQPCRPLCGKRMIILHAFQLSRIGITT
jgi:hypothetical protein